MSKKYILYHIGSFSHVASCEITNWVNRKLGTDYPWTIIYAEEGDKFDHPNQLLFRNNKYIRVDYCLIANLDLFVKVAVDYHWTMDRGIDFNVQMEAVSQLQVRYYYSPVLLDRAYRFYQIPPRD